MVTNSDNAQPHSLLVAQAIIEALCHAEVQRVFYSPGSRCAPFAFALEMRELEQLHRPDSPHLDTTVCLDERSAAFQAVGASKIGFFGEAQLGMEASAGAVSHRPHPVALIGTSGGAIAEYHPAVAEASHANLPLIVLSADRPFEMHGVGASQTTTQAGIFGPHCRGVWDIPADQLIDGKLIAIIQRAVHCARGTLGTRPGPVQINVGFREPLAPTSFPLLHPLPVLEYDWSHAVDTTIQPTPWEDLDCQGQRVIMLAGDSAPAEAAEWAEAAGIPLLAEPTSGLTHSSSWIPFQQAFLSPGSPVLDQIEHVIVVGRPTLSRPVTALLARPNVATTIVAEDHEWLSAGSAFPHATTVLRRLAAPTAPHDDTTWLPQWKALAEEARERMAALLDAEELTALSVADTIWRALPDGQALFLGASNTIRAFDLAISTPAPGPVLSNRGLAGIDGTIASAIGSGARVAVMGDLTFFHDVSSLVSWRCHPLIVVVLDDAGGGIFDSLEYSPPGLHSKQSSYLADSADPSQVTYAERHFDAQRFYDRWFETRQSASIEGLAAGYGIPYLSVTSADELARIVRDTHHDAIVHVKIPRPTALMTQAKRVVNESSGGPSPQSSVNSLMK